MADQTSATITIEASPHDVMEAIADFAAYPTWATAVKSVEVLDTYDDGRAQRVHFVLNAGVLKDEYTLAYTWDGDRATSWELEEGRVLKALDGSYTLRDRGRGRTEVTYRLSVDVSMPMIGPLRRRAERMIIDTALKELKRFVEGHR